MRTILNGLQETTGRVQSNNISPLQTQSAAQSGERSNRYCDSLKTFSAIKGSTYCSHCNHKIFTR